MAMTDAATVPVIAPRIANRHDSHLPRRIYCLKRTFRSTHISGV